MIRNIKSLKHYGVFQNYTNSGVDNFGRFNLFYGWNGSGKSTLSDVFRCVENKTLSDNFPDAKFELSTETNLIISHDNISEADQNIYTFNQDFIKENISWNNVVKSILLIDNEKIKDHKSLESMKNKKEIDTDTYKRQANEIKKLEKSISDFYTKTARNIKNSLQAIDTNDNHYLNYNKTKFENFFNKHTEEIKSDDALLNNDELNKMINTAKPVDKTTIAFSQQTITEDTFTRVRNNLHELLTTSVVNQTIQRLIDHNDISSWVEVGLEIHKKYEVNECEFCGNKITKQRIAELESHFNNDYKAFKDQLVKAGLQLKNLPIQLSTLPEAGSFYEEYKNEYEKSCRTLKTMIDNLNERISEWQDIIGKKIDNPLEMKLTIQDINMSSIKDYNDAISSIKKIIDEHNHKSKNFKKETEKAKKSLELHYAISENRQFDVYSHNEKIDDLKKAQTELKKKICELESEIQALENSLSDEGLGADQFNKSLQGFLGHSELRLRFNTTKKGYEIIRNNSKPVQESLSEGEKTAIAFVYFLTKLKENNNSIEETIVVIDDPMSSFDSTHLYHAYSFMKMNCEKAKQLFVLTHNFTFFKLIRDWIRKKNNTEDKNIAKFYVIETDNESPRTSGFINATSALKDYHSEYHYIFSKLYKFKSQETLKTDDHFLAANLSRKLLEAFLSFKFPKSRGNFAELLNHAFKACYKSDDERKEKIYKFVNQYSHYGLIETNEEIAESTIGESSSIISDVFDLIKKLDEEHFNEMSHVVT